MRPHIFIWHWVLHLREPARLFTALLSSWSPLPSLVYSLLRCPADAKGIIALLVPLLLLLGKPEQGQDWLQSNSGDSPAWRLACRSRGDMPARPPSNWLVWEQQSLIWCCSFSISFDQFWQKNTDKLQLLPFTAWALFVPFCHSMNCWKLGVGRTGGKLCRQWFHKNSLWRVL